MTEAMSRHEIEDVLTSIRRLVSHDDRAPAPAAQGKLVLTSALRVDTPEQDLAATPPDDAGLVAGDTASSAADAQGTMARPALVQPNLADAPVRPPLLTRIAQAGHLSAAPPEPPQAFAPDPDPLEDALTDSALEATLSRLEEALSITPKTASQHMDQGAVDESALSQMVARIVRQELQGELGERITRNIRKLVRAEVARELQMRNL